MLDNTYQFGYKGYNLVVGKESPTYIMRQGKVLPVEVYIYENGKIVDIISGSYGLFRTLRGTMRYIDNVRGPARYYDIIQW